MIRQLIQFGKAVLAIAVTVTQLTACGLEDGSDSASATDDVVISGSVGDGPITGATVTTYNDRGEQLASVTSDIYATYRSTIKFKGREYPLTMEVSGGIDLVTGATPDFKLYSVAISRKEKSVNINPFSTLAVKIARLMPGEVTKENIDTAINHVTSQLAFGLDLNIIRNPITTRINDDNVANIVKASEAMGEMIRRTRDVVTSTGTMVTGDDVMDALAADMVDGFLDGVGAAGTRPSISAVANVVSGQVLVEALSNNLKVGGVIATDLIDQAILLTRLDINSDQMTDSVRITDSMLKQTRVALAAALVIDTSEGVTGIAASVDSIAADSLPAVIATYVPADTSASLDNAVVLSSTASDEDTSAINQTVHAVDTAEPAPTEPEPAPTEPEPAPTEPEPAPTEPAPEPTEPAPAPTEPEPAPTEPAPEPTEPAPEPTEPEPVNTAPTINGSPASSVVENDNYSFQPVAADADGDLLVFSIANKPGWASFNDTTGRLSGTPAKGDARVYDSIRISVTDGAETASLTAFSIQVEPQPVVTASMTLEWVAPVAREDGAPLSLADIDGYHVHYGDTPGNYTSTIDVTDGTAQSVIVGDLPVGTYYVVMTTYDVTGMESGFSEMATKTVQ